MKVTGFLFLLIAIYGCAAKPDVVEPDAGADGARMISLYVVEHGWHVGLAVAAEELNPIIPELKERFIGAKYYELGWGDEGFYQSRETTTGLTLQAIFWSRGAVVHVAALTVSPDRFFALGPRRSIVHTCLNAEEVRSLTQYLANSFTRDAADDLIARKRGLYGDSQFYDGEGRYHLLNTSNKWVAKALKSAGMKLSPTFMLTAGSVMESVKSNRKDCTV